ncbi:MAG: type I-C CRISPR-associated endonuclease Cas1c [Thermoanaerobaculia bacterium]
MKRYLNTLYVTTQGAYLSKESETVLVRVGDETKLRVPIHQLGSIVCFGQVSVSPFLMGFCAERNVAICYLTEHGRFLARVQGAISGNVLLRREQYRAADDPTRTGRIAGSVVSAKVANARAVLQRALRERNGGPETDEIGRAVRSLSTSIDSLMSQEDADTIRGIEGTSARAYFEVFDLMIGQQKSDFFFRERSRRPPLDNVNALLSFVYTLVRHDVEAALESVGLDPAVGFLHRDRPGRPGLALDLMEELRAPLADRLVLSLINLRQVSATGFRKEEAGGVVMDDETRKAVIVAYQKRKQEEIEHPFLQEKAPVGLLPFLQALLLARYLRGDLDGYPPLFWK